VLDSEAGEQQALLTSHRVMRLGQKKAALRVRQAVEAVERERARAEEEDAAALDRAQKAPSMLRSDSAAGCRAARLTGPKEARHPELL